MPPSERQPEEISRDITSIPKSILDEKGDEYERKNADYGASWYEIGQVLWILSGREPVTIESPEDFVRIGLYTRRLDKLFRSFNGEFRSDELNFESVEDSHSDEGVYGMMAAALCRFEDDRGDVL